jgi:hypothetical protein
MRLVRGKGHLLNSHRIVSIDCVTPRRETLTLGRKEGRTR